MKFSSQIKILLAITSLVISVNQAQAKVSDIGKTTVVKVKNYCTARGSGGRDGYGVGTYTAPTGYSIVKAQVSLSKSHKSPCRKCSISRTTHTQPGFIQLHQATKVKYSKSLNNLAMSLEDPIASAKMNAVSSLIDSLRVIDTSTHSVVSDKCHAESHRRITGNKNGWGYYDLTVTLKKEPISNDFVGAILELIKATEKGDTDRFYKVADLLNR